MDQVIQQNLYYIQYRLGETHGTSEKFISFKNNVWQKEIYLNYTTPNASSMTLSANKINTSRLSANQRLCSKHRFENPPEFRSKLKL